MENAKNTIDSDG